ncbi:BnaCnng64430D [Brassica napus]|uniref:BnaCnng64430D protein n=1 Tax=Brassica napus TaxID=3708 RepID=A0A078JT50_BRANA|nr:BnaCnng64430D [Brassica napus]
MCIFLLMFFLCKTVTLTQ